MDGIKNLASMVDKVNQNTVSNKLKKLKMIQ